MLLLWIFFGLLIAMLAYLLFAPIFLELNTITQFYGIRFHRLASAKLICPQNRLTIHLSIIGWHKQVELHARYRTKKQKPSVAPKRKSLKARLNMARALMASFKIRECYINIDTGNNQVSGLLFPAFFWLAKFTGKQIAINFTNQNQIVLEIENNMARLLKALIYSFILKKQ